MDRVRPQNLAFLSADDDRQRLHASTLGIYEGPAPLHPELIDRVEAALPLVPRFRQRVQEVPLRLGRPVWIDDDSFQAEHHVRHTSLPSPGADAQLRELVGRLASNPLDRHHPLWELWQIDGLEDGRWALLSKSHQAIVDGVAGTPLRRHSWDPRGSGCQSPSHLTLASWLMHSLIWLWTQLSWLVLSGRASECRAQW